MATSGENTASDPGDSQLQSISQTFINEPEGMYLLCKSIRLKIISFLSLRGAALSKIVFFKHEIAMNYYYSNESKERQMAIIMYLRHLGCL